ncbi:MAG: GNAT family N-acetyltransferase [Acidobacteria bacterium]|nr:GNAT family N-acetyltransferase [Acidobacteriota bacterium]
MQIVDLHQIAARQLAPLLEEEQACWLEELHWDYRPSSQLIKKFIDAKSLAGRAAMADDNPAGYGFYVLDEAKALIGGLYVSPKYEHLRPAEQILSDMLREVRALPGVRRIEAQLMPFGGALDAAMVKENFRLFTRQFMILPLKEAQMSGTPVPHGLRLERWEDGHFESCARLIAQAYANHIDSEINDQYRTEAGATKFLKNIVILPGCGQFLPEASFVVRAEESSELTAAVLTSTVSMGVGHITQICVMPEFQGQRLGLRLMDAAIRALKSLRYHALTLTVTSQNAGAVRLYEKLGFHVVKKFAAAVWECGE